MNQHPTDVMIRGIILGHRTASQKDREAIGDHVFSSSFLSLESLQKHLAKRLRDRQWAHGVSIDNYLADLRSAMKHPLTRIGLFRARGGHVVVGIAQTLHIVPMERLGEAWLPLLVVIYTADHGRIVSGYQASGTDTIRIGKDVQWLPPERTAS